MAGFIDYNKTTKSKDYRGSGSFATFMIIGRTFVPLSRSMHARIRAQQLA
jgi:hypothetical protein